MNAWDRLDEACNRIRDNNYRRVVPVDPQRLSDALESQSYKLWMEAESNPTPWYER